MSDETKSVDTDIDPIKQLKAEFSRKLDNSESKVSALMESQQALMAKLEEMSSSLKPQVDSSKDDFYNDPDAYVQRVTEKTVNEAIARQQSAQSTITALYDQFPEFQDPDSELSKKAVEIYSRMPKSEQKSPSALRLAALEAASELDVRPRKKRAVSEDDEPIGYGQGAPRKRQDRLDPVTEQWASLLGIDSKDPQVRQRLIEKQRRGNR